MDMTSDPIGGAETGRNNYRLAGWLTIIMAILIVPQVLLAILFEVTAKGHPLANILMGAIYLSNAIIGVYILYMFRVMLNERYDFHLVDVLINILIAFNVLSMLNSLLGMIANLEMIISILTIVLMIPYGIVQIIFAVRMLKLDDDLFGLLKPFAYTMMAAGICAATIILLLPGLLVAIVNLVIMGMIFLRAKEQVEFI
ncbi:MAG: hypothetical protein GY841_14765 [FCB group bacterium]|nr:hypothetical protein [FCB group bacterium]